MSDDDFTADANGAAVTIPDETPPAPVEQPLPLEAQPEPEVVEEAPARDEQGRFAKSEQPRDSRDADTVPTDADTVPAGTPESQPKKSSIQRRIDQAVLLQRKAEADRDYWRQQAELRAQSAPPRSEGSPTLARSEQTPDDVEPTFERFTREHPDHPDPYVGFQKELGLWAGRQAYRAEKAREQAAQQEQQNRARITKYQQDMQVLRATTPDFDSLMQVANATPVTKELSDAILDSDVSARLVLYLAQHADAYDALRGLTGGPLLRALGRLEARLVAAPSGPAAQAPSITRANAPIKPVPSSPIVTDTPPTDSSSDDAHFEYWNRKEREAGRR